MNRAKEISSWSKDPSTKVGAVIVRPNNTQASEGYNGFPQKLVDKRELYLNRETKYSRIIHAELNAILFAKEALDGYTLYTYPLPPCDRCAVIIIQSGITRVVAQRPLMEMQLRWGKQARLSEDYFKEAGVEFCLWP